jgi:hypothetical protein
MNIHNNINLFIHSNLAYIIDRFINNKLYSNIDISRDINIAIRLAMYVKTMKEDKYGCRQR